MNQYRNIKFDDPLEFRVTRAGPCSYLDGRNERRLVADLSRHPHLHDRLARAGFRRVENWIYRPICKGCNACKPIRIHAGNADAGAFTPSRSQRRILRRNTDLARAVLPNLPGPEHYALFRRYIDSRHHGGQMIDMGEMHYADMIAASPIDTVLVEYRLPADNDAQADAADGVGPPIAVMLVDLQKDGLSAVYSFYDPAPEMRPRSLGTFMILDLAAIAHEMNLPYVYLGYYIAESTKMNYKARFDSAEIFDGGRWSPL